MLSSLVWVPKGIPRQYPVRFEVSPEEYKRIKDLSKEEINDSKDDPNAAETTNEDELPDEFKMDEYDDEIAGLIEDDNDIEDEEEFEMMEQGDSALINNIDEGEEDDEDAEDDEVKPTDSMIVTAITEDDFSHLEVHIYSEDGALFVHHDINLPEFPLCLAWLDCPPYRIDGNQTTVGNYVAVGTFDPCIEIWNLDVLDPLEPTASLGGIDSTTKSMKKKKGHKSYKSGSHEDAVMALSWNNNYRQALCSGSADKTVKIWDVTTQTCSHTFTHHTDKVQSVVWHPQEGWQLATGSFDKTVQLLDCRQMMTSAQYASYMIEEDIETLVWNPHDFNQLYVALENGKIICMDRRNTTSALYTFQAHDKAVTSISFNSHVPGMMATASMDKTVRVWDIINMMNQSADPHLAPAPLPSHVTPQMIAYKSIGVGKLFTMEYCMDDPFLLATGGDQGMVAIWESDEQHIISEHFTSRIKQKVKTTNEMEIPHQQPHDISHNSNTNKNNQDNNTILKESLDTLDSTTQTKKEKKHKKKGIKSDEIISNTSNTNTINSNSNSNNTVIEEDDSWMDIPDKQSLHKSNVTMNNTNTHDKKKKKKK